MKLTLETGSGQNLINAYGEGQVTINQHLFTRSLIVTPDRIVEWLPRGFDELVAEHFDVIAGLQPEVVVLGTGARLRWPAPECLRSLIEARVGLEPMDTGAACRTYNILMSEGRRVVAALLMIENQGSPIGSS
jgi:uncharacterized protein